MELIGLSDPAIGLRGVIAIHSTKLGPAFGGIRRRVYRDEAEGRADAWRLAEAMSCKCALAGLPAGGGKTVVLDDVDAIYDAIGDAVEQLRGRYVCGPDIGTGAQELERVRARTRWVNPAGNDAGASTAAGVLAGLRAVWRFLGVEPSRSRAAIQGLGAVGLALARSLRELGVAVIGADIDRDRIALAREMGVDIVEPDAVMLAEVDVLVPCAAGGVLTRDAVAQLKCRAICGSANNQLADDDAARALVDAGIVHAPDIVVSAGAVIEGVLTMARGTSPAVRAEVAKTIADLESVTRAILERARIDRAPPHDIARQLARERLT
jgi:glutamate dehydrogenase/leucine dehydrogenase